MAGWGVGRCRVEVKWRKGKGLRGKGKGGLFFTVEGGFWESLGKKEKGEGEICWGAALGGGGVVYHLVEDDSRKSVIFRPST